MNFKINTKITIILSSLIVAVLLFVAIFQGAKAGKDTAQADAIIEAAQNLSAGLEYFYNDQDRFPNVLEYGDQNIMLNYFNVFPVPSFVSSFCRESFVYKKNTSSGVSLSFCLPKEAGGYQKGWNILNFSK